MVWGAFIGFDKCPLIIMPPDNRTASDFVTIVYEGALSGFYFLHDHPQQLKFMESKMVLQSTIAHLTLQWRQAHGLAKPI
jgi:hypothetical protein